MDKFDLKTNLQPDLNVAHFFQLVKRGQKIAGVEGGNSCHNNSH